MDKPLVGSLKDRLFPPNAPPAIWLLLDPDHDEPEALAETAAKAEEAGVKAILVGGSFIAHDGFDDAVKAIKGQVRIPVVLFPGGSRQVSKYADGILFMSLLSGRNPQYLIGEQVMAAPIIKKLGLSHLSMAYLLIESGVVTSAGFVSDTRPIPRDKPKFAVAHAMAAELFGMQAVYLEAGSGAKLAVPEEMIRMVAKSVSIPIIAGGGITTPELAAKAATAGARAIVVGTAVEKGGAGVLREMVEAVETLEC